MISTSNGKIKRVAPLMLFNLKKKTSLAKRRMYANAAVIYTNALRSSTEQNILIRRTKNFEHNILPGIPKNRPVLFRWVAVARISLCEIVTELN